MMRIKRVYSDTDEKDRVVRQSEAANSKVAQGHDRDARGLGRPRADGGPDGSADHRADGAGADDGIL